MDPHPPNEPLGPDRLRQLQAQLAPHFGEIPPHWLEAIGAQVQWQTLDTGQVLIAEGDPGDAAFITISGRLRVYARQDDGTARMLRELGRGEMVGELSLFTGAPRSATVVAVRRSVVVRLDQTAFRELASAKPHMSLALTQKIIERLQTQHRHQPVPAPVMLTVVPIGPAIDSSGFVDSLATALRRHGRVAVLPPQTLEGPSPEAQLAQFNALEAQHDFVLLLADPAATDWTQLCLNHSDEVLWLADAAQAPTLHPVEAAWLTAPTPARREVADTLVLLHPASTAQPQGMRAWLDRRPVAGHVHLRPGRADDWARLARLLSRTAVGLVLGGGGARGFAHLGVWRALRERGVDIDCIGGTSMGALMGVVMAADGDPSATLQVVRDHFRVNPTGDYNWLPLISLIKGRRVRQAIDRALQRLVGGPIDMVDLWKPFFCVASNYSQGREVRLQRGDVSRCLLASSAIPGALPPVVMAGDLYCDGATFNNFPVDVMREQRGVGRVIGIDLGVPQARKLDFDEVPSTWRLLRDRLRPRNQRRYKVPSLMSYLLNVTILYSTSRRDTALQQTDLSFSPPLQKTGLLKWKRFDEIVQIGEDHAHAVLDALSPEDKAAWGVRDRVPD